MSEAARDPGPAPGGKKKDENVKWVPLAESGFPRLLYRFASDKVTGLLYLTSGEQRITVVFVDGAPVFANSNSPETNLGMILASRGVISRAQLDEAVVEAKGSGKQLGSILVEKSLLSSEDLAQYLREQIKSILLKVFSWEGGYSYFETQAISPREALPVFKNPLELVLVGIRQGFTLNRLLRGSFKQETVLAQREIDFDKPPYAGLDWGAAIEKVLPLINGKRSIRQVAEKSGLEGIEALKALYSLFVLECVEEIEGTTATPAAEVIVAPSPVLGSGPEIIAPDADARVEITEETRPVTPEVALVSPAKSTPAESGSAARNAPMILGDVEELENAYQAKKKESENRPPAAPKDDEVGDRAGEITLEEIHLPKPKARRMESPSDPGEITIEPKVSAPAVKVEKTPEPPAPKPKTPKKTAPPPEEGLPPLPSTGGKWMKWVGGMVLTAVLLLAGLGLFVYLETDVAVRALDRVRLVKMYGKPSLDAKRLAQFYEDDGQLKHARLYFQEALAQTPNDDRLALTLAKVYIRLEEWDAAKKLLEEIMVRNPSLTEAHLSLGWCYLREGDVARAKRELYLYLANSPVSPQTESIRKLVQGLP